MIKMSKITRYGEAGHEIHQRPAGSVLTVVFELEGQSFTALNGGPLFNFSEAVSFQVICATQKEADHYWDRLTAGGDPAAQQCGWLKDKFGFSWQVIPKAALELLADHKSKKSQRAFAALMPMKKLDLAALKRAYDGR